MYSLKKSLPTFFEEDGLAFNDYYWYSLPSEPVSCIINFKSENHIISGLPFFFEVFEFLLQEIFNKKNKVINTLNHDFSSLLKFEGKITPTSNELKKFSEEFQFNLPFNVAVSGERIALNLLQRSSSISAMTSKFVKRVENKNLPIKILETRKTTPGLRFLEKYAIRVGGGANHRFTQTDIFMIKDNHKKIFGGLKEAVHFFKNLNAFYTPLIVEIHSLEELEESISLAIDHVMLDNFSIEDIKQAIKLKPNKGKLMTYEISGGIHLDNLDQYLLPGVDAISIGALTNSPTQVDISFKFKKI